MMHAILQYLIIFINFITKSQLDSDEIVIARREIASIVEYTYIFRKTFFLLYKTELSYALIIINK